MDAAQKKILDLIEQAVGSTNVLDMDFQPLDKVTKERINFSKVRGSVRLMSGKIKTASDVSLIRQNFINLKLP